MLSQLRRPARRDEGAAAVEFALVVPILLVVVFGIISFGIFFAGALGLSNATREAARYGVVQNRTCADIMSTLASSVTGTLGVKYPVSFTAGRPGGPQCSGSIASNGSVSFGSNQMAVLCQGSKTGQDELTVTTSATADLIIPTVVIDNAFPLTSKGTYRCEFS